MIKLMLLCVALGGVEYIRPAPKAEPPAGLKQYTPKPERYHVTEDIMYEKVMEDFYHYGDDYQHSCDVQWSTVWVKREAKNGMSYWEYAGAIYHTYAYECDVETGEEMEIENVHCFYRRGKPEEFNNCTLEAGVEWIGEKFREEKDEVQMP